MVAPEAVNDAVNATGSSDDPNPAWQQRRSESSIFGGTPPGPSTPDDAPPVTPVD